MIADIFNWAVSANFSNLAGLFLYWIPVLLCLLGTARTIVITYREDVNKCGDEYFLPKFTVGLIVGGVLTSFIPIYNLGKSVFGHVPEMLDVFLQN